MFAEEQKKVFKELIVEFDAENVIPEAEGCKEIPNGKAQGRDGVEDYCIIQLSSINERIANQLNEIISGANRIPEWMIYGRTVLCQKDPAKGRAVDNYRPISCLP